MAVQAGEKVGPWEVQKPLGKGGMGEVWACHHVDDGRRGALKVLRAGMGSDDLARFVREMTALGKLRHHAIVDLLDHDLSDPMKPWLVMEHIEGPSLEEVIDQGPMPLDAVLRPFAALADGLAQAHAYGIHHRDVKANNVILQPNGTMVLVDFGAAIEDDSMEVTQAGMMLGTTRYLPPEVVCGEDRDLVSADIYALGMLLYEVVTGSHAFRGKDKPLKFREVLSAKMKTRHLDPGAPTPEEVRKVVRLATAADPDERLNRMDDMADLLEVASGSAGRTPMMSLRRSERITYLGAQPDRPAPLGDEPTERHTQEHAHHALFPHHDDTTEKRPPPPPPPPAPTPDATKLLPHPARSPADIDLTQDPEPTVRLAPDQAGLQLSPPLDHGPPAHDPVDGPTVRLTPQDSALVPDEGSGFDWMLFGALLFLCVGLLTSASILVLGVAAGLYGSA